MEHFSPFCTAWWLSFWDTTVYHNTAELVSKLLKFVIQFTSLKKDLAVFTGLPWSFVQKAKIYRQLLPYNIYCNFEAMRDVNEYRLILLKATQDFAYSQLHRLRSVLMVSSLLYSYNRWSCRADGNYSNTKIMYTQCYCSHISCLMSTQ